MKLNHIDHLIVKYLNHSINKDELDELNSLLEQPENKEIFKDYAKINYSIDYKLRNYRAENVKKYLQDRIRKDNNVFSRGRFLRVSKYAAILVLAVGTLLIFQKDNAIQTTSEPFHKEHKITLEMENGRSVILQEEATQDIISEKGEVIGKQIKQGIQFKDAELSELVYNTLKVPYGKKFQVTLSDGTKVFLNSGSSMKFPVKFIKGANRTVFLTGEAFFEVAKNKDPFIVSANNAKIRALGTAFNVSAYPGEKDVSTVLVEGSVGIYRYKEQFSKEHSTVLEPDHMAIWNKEKKEVIVKVVDVEMYTAWVSGKMIFRNTPFKIIRKKLERHYNIQIINNNRELDEKVYNAVFDVETIREVMQTLDESFSIKYTIENNKIIIE
ncbi:FecR family protein [Arenibacter nanhaiticus]|uniref:FecR family protein n=1 Tax=Arenibacter nanhaiticus TaxID=558155 RepID=A0A1M6C0C6_9FLAO|nr:FecR domain-containing protein [Arenibacter nanhaiticus]SHI54138.1 FecR family protein [Arenibacter nanhaiticus]